jgi:hypothetical protein
MGVCGSSGACDGGVGAIVGIWPGAIVGICWGAIVGIWAGDSVRA